MFVERLLRANNYSVHITMSDGTQSGKRADVALQVASGELAGIEVVGFTVWESRIGPNVTFPARKFTGRDGKERVLVRRSVKRADATGMSRLRVMILEANSQAALEADRQANPAHTAPNRAMTPLESVAAVAGKRHGLPHGRPDQNPRRQRDEGPSRSKPPRPSGQNCPWAPASVKTSRARRGASRS